MISIIIIVKNDVAVENTIVHLLKANKSEKTEIIVIDASQGKLNFIKKKYPQVKWINFISKSFKKITIPDQRNVGIANAIGDIIVFIDANCIPTANWLKTLTKPIIEDKENIVAGLAKSSNKKTIHDTTHEFNKSKKYLNECPTINLAVKKDVFKKVGLFDVKFNYGSDVDFSWRAIDEGYKIYYEDKAIVYHDWGSTKDELRRSYYYGAARATLYKKHKKMLIRIFQRDIVAVTYSLFILFLPITFFWKYYPLLLLIPFLRNIKKKPLHTLIDHLVFGFGFLYNLL